MNAMEFSVNQLSIAGEYQRQQEIERQRTDGTSEKIMREIVSILERKGGCTRSQIAGFIGRKEISIRFYIQELARQDRIVLCLQEHNKPAIYRIKK